MYWRDRVYFARSRAHDRRWSIVKREEITASSRFFLLRLSRIFLMIDYLRSGLFVFQHFHRLFLPETETGNTGASENLERAGQGRLLEECVAAIQ